MKSIPIDLSTLRNLIFDIGGLDREFILRENFPSLTVVNDILVCDKDYEFFYPEYTNDKTSSLKALWQPRAWKESAERYYKERERNAKEVSRHELRKEALEVFGASLWKSGYIKTSRVERTAIGEMLLRKRNFIKFAALSGLDLTENKWKGLME